MTSAGRASERRVDRTLHSRHLLALGSLLGLFLISTAAFLATHPFHWDGAQFVLGVQDYSVVLHQPHPPGYPLFIAAAKLISFFLSPYRSLQLESLLFALAAVSAVYFLGLEIWRSRLAAWVGAVCLMFNPLFWLYRETGLTYTVDAFAGPVLALLLLRGWRGRPGLLLWSALFLGLISGFRPSLSFLLLPLLLGVMLANGSGHLLLKGTSLWLIGILSWTLPMFSLDGFGPTLQAMIGLFAPADAWSGVFPFLQTRWSQTGRLAGHLAGSMNLLWLSCAWGLASGLRSLGAAPLRRFLIIAGLWFCPPLLFFSAVHFGQIGYLLILLPLPCLLTAGLFYGGQFRAGSCLALATLLISNLVLFSIDLTAYIDPRFRPHSPGDRALAMLGEKTPSLFGLSQRLLDENDRRMEAFLSCITRFSPDEVMVIGGPNSASVYRTYWPIPIDDVYRNLAAELPAYRILVPSAEDQAVFETHQYQTMLHDTPELELPASVRHLVATVDSIPAACSPSGIEFQRLDFQGQSCFVAEVDGSFTYCGIRFLVPGS